MTMPISQFNSYNPYDQQPTAATGYYEALKQRFNTQQAQGVPRSARAWDAEKNQLGSWNTGVSTPTRSAPGYQPGIGQPSFNYGGNNTP